jgi:hypothetical protein
MIDKKTIDRMITEPANIKLISKTKVSNTNGIVIQWASLNRITGNGISLIL